MVNSGKLVHPDEIAPSRSGRQIGLEVGSLVAQGATLQTKDSRCRPNVFERPKVHFQDDIEVPTSDPVDGQTDDAIDVAANRPHPSLETPPLYWLLKERPMLLNIIKGWYALRWRMSYKLQRTVPFSRYLRKAGIHLTRGEFLLIALFAGLVVMGFIFTFVNASVSKTGHVARSALIAAVILAQRNSIVTLLIGMPIDRTIFYHKLSAKVAYVATIGHAISYFLDPALESTHGRDLGRGGRGHHGKGTSMIPQEARLNAPFEGQANISGWFMLLFMTGIMISTLPAIRRRCFEAFYYLHILFAVGVVAGALFHTGVLVPFLVFGTWGVDVILRSLVMARSRYPREANILVVSETVVELSFPKWRGFDYNPGQYIYIALPELSWLEWHPFSISSSPKQGTVTLHIRKAGDWTSALHDLAKKKSSVSILMEGPYGSLSVDLMSERYKMILLVSGGIGITAMQSICQNLLHEQAKGRRDLRRLRFIWTERDPVHVRRADFVRHNSIRLTKARELRHPASEKTMSLASRLLSTVPAGQETDVDLDQLYESTEIIFKQDEQALENHPVDSAWDKPDETEETLSVADTTLADNDETPWDVENDPENLGLHEVFDMQVYLTGNHSADMVVPYARRGRPDIKAIFLQMKEEALACGQKRVAVCVCAPVKLSHLCRKACILYSDRRVRFDFHSEPTA